SNGYKKLIQHGKRAFHAIATPFTLFVTLLSAKRFINEGYDFFGTDPKGTNIRDVGHLYEQANYDIKCFNTIDPSASLHYNPYVYIDTRLVDIKSADDLVNDLLVKWEDESTAKLHIDGEVAGTERTIASQNGIVIMDTEVSRQIITYEKLEETDERIREDLKEISSRLGKEIESVVRDFSYKRSEVTISLTYRNTDWREHSAKITLALDPALEPLSMKSFEDQGANFDQATNTLTWDTGLVEGRPKDVDNALAPYRMLKVYLRIKPMRIADGVSLTKNINCLVKNLNEDVKASGDMKFWEDTKLLAFMSYVALQFERYEPKYRNIPETIRILNMAMVDAENPNASSPLDILMEAWETGFIYMPNQDDEDRSPRSKQKSGSWQSSGNDPHDSSHSLALHCYKAYNSGAAETRQSILASCHAAFVKLLGEDIQELLRYDEMALDTLGEAGQKQAIFVIPDAVDETYGFLFALMTYQAMSMFCDRAVKRHKGRAPRHVRFEIDEAGTIGKITQLDRIIAVIRSLNASIALYFQSKSQAVKVYGEKEAEIIIDNCTTTTFLGSQSEETLEMISKLIGDETVYGATSQRTFDACGFTTSENENVQSTSRKVRSSAQLRREDKHKMLAFVLGMRPVLDNKFPTENHPLYRYIDPDSPRSLTQPACLFDKRFDYQEYRRRKEKKKAA
ncbi:MAG: TraM recognition domain-containing protein, partial [Raoultibacter sp.]